MDVEVASTSLWDGHVGLLYCSEREHDALAAAWMRRGLDRGEKVVLTRGPDEAEDAFQRLCVEAGVDPERSAGQLVSLPPEQFYPPQGQEELIARAYAEGFSGVRLSAQAPTALSIMSEGAYLAAEQAMDRHCRSRSVSVLCAYPRPAPMDHPLRDTLATHSDGVRSLALGSARSERGVHLYGEVDLTTWDVLAAALDVALRTIGATDELVLDLSGLDFIDVAGSRTLVRVTADFRDAGGRLVLERPQRSVARALRLMDVDRARGVRLVEAQ